MIRKFVYIVVLFFPTLAFSQELKIGVGLIANEEAFNPTTISFDDLTIFEGNQKNSDPVIFPYLGYQMYVSKRFSAQIGLQYYRNWISLVVNKPVKGTPNIPDSGKIRTVENRNLEVPIELNFTALKTNQITLRIRGGIVPVWSSSKSSRLEEVPEGPDWSQEVVDALNAAETIPKSFYMNYQYGLGLGYGRFELSIFQSANLSNSISNGYTLYGTTYSFERRIRSTRIGLYYSFGLKKKDKE